MAEPSLDLLQAMVQRVLDNTGVLRHDMRDIKQCLTRLEAAVATVRLTGRRAMRER
jgi:hypothetical protein